MYFGFSFQRYKFSCSLFFIKALSVIFFVKRFGPVTIVHSRLRADAAVAATVVAAVAVVLTNSYARCAYNEIN